MSCSLSWRLRDMTPRYPAKAEPGEIGAYETRSPRLLALDALEDAAASASSCEDHLADSRLHDTVHDGALGVARGLLADVMAGARGPEALQLADRFLARAQAADAREDRLVRRGRSDNALTRDAQRAAHEAVYRTGKGGDAKSEFRRRTASA